MKNIFILLATVIICTGCAENKEMATSNNDLEKLQHFTKTAKNDASFPRRSPN